MNPESLEIRKRIKAWYKKNKRNLPWRETSDPYKIWVSEIILQQTRVSQGISQYLKFIAHFPNLKALASATEEEVLKVWQGMGYYSRALNMHKTALLLVNNHDGMLPETPEALKKLPGIGSYTAAAIASIAFHFPVATVDANAMRIIARVYGIEQNVEGNGIKKKMENLAIEWLDREKPGEFNQALMDFGSLQCTPVNPLCVTCPLVRYCKAYLLGKVDKIPARRNNKVPRKRYFHYLVLTDGEYIYVQKRLEDDIWKSLYEFPLVELSTGKQPSMENWYRATGIPHIEIRNCSKLYHHSLSHQVIHAIFYTATVPSGNWKILKNLLRIPIRLLESYPVPALVARYLSDSGIASIKRKG